MTFSTIATTCTIAALLTAAGCTQAAPVLMLPSCADGMGLSTDSQGNFQCAVLTPVSLAVPLPAQGCAAGQVLDYAGDSSQLSCVDKTGSVAGLTDGSALRQHIDALAAKVDVLRQAVAQLAATGGAEARFVGSTLRLTSGRIVSGSGSGSLAGLAAATALCSGEFGDGAHMCTPFELTRSVALGALGPKSALTPSWIYMPTWHNPKSSTSEPNSGLADNCGGYTTEDDAVGWTGTAVEWSPLPSGELALRWHGGDEALCSSLLPIACCAGAAS